MDNTNYTSHSLSSGHIIKQFESDIENISLINHSNPNPLKVNYNNYVPYQKPHDNRATITKSEFERTIDANNTIPMLSSQIYQLTSERNNLIAQIDSYTNDLITMEDKLQSAHNEIHLLRRKVDALNTEGRDYCSHISALQLENSNLINKLDECAATNDQLTKTIENYQKQIEQMQNDIQSIQHQTIQFDSLSNEFVKLKNKYHSLMKSTPNIIGNGKGNGTSSDSSSYSLESIQKENRKLRKNLDLFYKENHAAAIRIKELEAEIVLLNNCNNKNNSISSNNRNSNNENAMLHMMVNSLNQKIETLQNEIYSLKQNRRAKSRDYYSTIN